MVRVAAASGVEFPCWREERGERARAGEIKNIEHAFEWIALAIGVARRMLRTLRFYVSLCASYTRIRNAFKIANE